MGTQPRVMSYKKLAFVASSTLVFALLGSVTSGTIKSDENETATIKAVPLEAGEESTSTGIDQVFDEIDFEMDSAENNINYMREDTTLETTEETTEETTKFTATPELPATSTSNGLPDGMIEWAPYSKDSFAKPVTLPAGFHGILIPKTSDVKSRWISKDIEKAKIINAKPAFILPQVAIIDQSDENKEKVMRKYQRSKRAATPMNPYVAICGGTFRDLYGVIQSPDYPLYYPNNKKCTYDIEVPADHTIKITCDSFIMQGGENCTHDSMMIDYTGDKTFANGQKFCGTDSPVMVTNGTRMTIKFESDDLFRYQGFSCRYRALMSNGIAVPGSFGNATDTTKPKYNGNNFLQVVQCPSLGGAAGIDDGSSDSNSAHGASLYSGMWNGRCGSQNLPPLNRIVGGYSTVEFEYPWIAAVLRTCGDKYCHICGATIISEEWILTGAHCMDSVPMEELGVLVGDHNLYTISTSQKFIKVKEKVIHPDYNTRGNMTSPLNNDIGLLRLEYPIIFTSQISPLCLPALGETGFGGSAYGTGNTTMLDTTGLGIVGTNATVLGWGMINDGINNDTGNGKQGDFSETLRGVEVEILDNKACNDLYGIMTENMMCTSGDNGRGTCFGDSGGPAIVTQPDGSYVQVGILSFGAQAGCEQGYPSGQVLVHKYIDWIQSVTGVAFGTSSV